MKSRLKSIALLWCALVASTSFAQKPPLDPETQCAQSVEASVSALELAKQLNTEKQTLKGLSIADIRAIQNSKGSCAANAEIRRRVF